jgi:Flp pilus assembly protein TadB
MVTLDLVAVALAAAAGWLAFLPRSGVTRLRRLGGPPAWPIAAARAGSPGVVAAPGGLASARARATAAGVAGVALAVLMGGSAGVAVGGIGAVIGWVVLGRLEPASVARDRRLVAAAVPLAADLISAGLSAGSPPERVADAVGAAVEGPLGDTLRRAAAALRIGTEPATAWAPLLADPATRSLGRALAGAVTRGSSPGAVLERVAADARDKARWEAEARARSLGARAAAPLGLCFLPAFVLVGIVPLIATVGLPVLP